MHNLEDRTKRMKTKLWDTYIWRSVGLNKYRRIVRLADSDSLKIYASRLLF